MEIRAITRKWGNSIAVIIPSRVVEQEKLKENQQITIDIEAKRPSAGALWGFGKGRFKKSAQELKDDARIGWLSGSDREREKE